MKEAFIIIFVLLTAATGYAQVDFEADTTYTKCLYPSTIGRIKKLTSDYDFQLRFWADGGLAIPARMSLFAMTLKDGSWSCSSYKIVYYGKKPTIEYGKRIDSCDYTWNALMENDILTLPDMAMLKKEMYNVENGDTLVIRIMDGQEYSIELLAQGKYRRIQYHCPVTHAKYFPRLKELVNASNIVKLIFRKLGYTYSPC